MSRLNLTAVPEEACDILAVPEVFEIPHSRWGLGVAVDNEGAFCYSEYASFPFVVHMQNRDSVWGGFSPRENTPQHSMLRIDEMAWDPIHKVMWGASRLWISDTTHSIKRMPYTRIYTIEFNYNTRYAECTFRFKGLGVPGPGFPTTGLTFDPFMGPHGTLWQHLEDGGASYTPFPITADLGTSGPGEPVYVGGYPGEGLVSGICVSPSGKYMYVSHGHDGNITKHDKLTGMLVAKLATGPDFPKRVCRGLEIDYRQSGCPKLLCTEGFVENGWGPTILVTYPITDD
ncbi:hypothetical protein IT157_07255 [bacterium]|nr:hypothetical protein [bacterium]